MRARLEEYSKTCGLPMDSKIVKKIFAFLKSISHLYGVLLLSTGRNLNKQLNKTYICVKLYTCKISVTNCCKAEQTFQCYASAFFISITEKNQTTKIN
jgi:hypothetical protein